MTADASRLVRRDYLLLSIYCLLLFGYSLINGRPLTMHEARLPETTREMAVNHDWLFPQSGNRPWLERPPLPHWILLAVTSVTGHNENILYVRLPSVVIGGLTVLLIAWMAARWFGRPVGVVSGLVLATMYEFWSYSTLGEEEVHLAALVAIAIALFAQVEFFKPGLAEDRRGNFFGGRPWQVLAFFIVVGLTNLVKGPLLGLAIVAVVVGSFQLLTFDRRRILRYVWLWGWLAMIALTVAWPLAAYRQYPDVLENWKIDYLGRISGSYAAINEPFWYYFAQLPLMLAPWTPIALLAFWVTWPVVRKQRQSPERFLWCWALVPVFAFSLLQGKHHHYLVPALAPWAILTAIVLVQIGGKLPRPRAALATILAGLLLGYCLFTTFFAARSDQTMGDGAFLRNAQALVPADKPLFINAEVGPLDFFRLQFYSRDDARLLHNLTYLRDQTIRDPEVYVITRARDEPFLETLGLVEQVAQSAKSHDDGGLPRLRFTLYRLRFDPALPRYPAPARITVMQAMDRDRGPYCGPPYEPAQPAGTSATSSSTSSPAPRGLPTR